MSGGGRAAAFALTECSCSRRSGGEAVVVDGQRADDRCRCGGSAQHRGAERRRGKRVPPKHQVSAKPGPDLELVSVAAVKNQKLQ